MLKPVANLCFSPLCHFWMVESNRVDLYDSPSTRQHSLSKSDAKINNSNYPQSFKSPALRHWYLDFYRINTTKFIFHNTAAFSCLVFLPKCQCGKAMIHRAAQLTRFRQQTWLIRRLLLTLADLKGLLHSFISRGSGGGCNVAPRYVKNSRSDRWLGGKWVEGDRQQNRKGGSGVEWLFYCWAEKRFFRLTLQVGLLIHLSVLRFFQD